MKRRILPLALSLLLLAGCGSGQTVPSGGVSSAPSAQVSDPVSLSPSAEPSADPSPAPSATSSVVTHWDVLDQGDRTPLANRLSSDYLPELIASDSYGAVFPYMGSELNVLFGEGEYAYTYQQALYGLCTADGLILTDPVYTDVFAPSWYDAETGQSGSLPIWLLARTLMGEDGEYYTAVGAAAQDGSWFTGLKYSAGLGSYLTTTKSGILLRLNSETVVMLGLDGTELFRWTLDDFLPKDSDMRESFFSDGLNWTLRFYQDYLCFNPQDLGLTGETRWFDPNTGKEVESPGVGVPDTTNPGRTYFSEGWYRLSGSTLILHYDSGQTETVSVPQGLGNLSEVSSDYLVFYQSGDTYTQTLTDHKGNVLAKVESPVSLALMTDEFTGRRWPCRITYSENDPECFILLPDGKELGVYRSWSSIYDGLVSVCDDLYYRLIDLNDGGRELIRLPRWQSMDFPADN